MESKHETKHHPAYFTDDDYSNRITMNHAHDVLGLLHLKYFLEGKKRKKDNLSFWRIQDFANVIVIRLMQQKYL